MAERQLSAILLELAELENEHEELNSLLDLPNKILDEITLIRLKKRKLYIKDKISDLKSRAYPDIIA